ncbi:MAG: GWxTD domain-containing protein [Candidatus Aminicenantes bacterium]|nr:GWxTD domain-containing protein [Candidatus Aminicenantes bacterium]
MRSKTVVILIGLLVLASGLPAAARPAQVQSLKPRELPEVYYRWLEEEVVYIISPVEREVFLKLRNDRERDLFIEAFWKHRDTNPATEENEYRQEHYRRISYANHFYGRTTPKPGWMTDRGRIYIILGEPNDVQRFEARSETHAAEIWFYQNQMEKGLPPAFNVVFYQKRGFGDYLLYSPAADGPMAFMPTYEGDPVDFRAAYEELLDRSPDLAYVSMSLIPGEGSAFLGRPSLASQHLLQQVGTAGWKSVQEQYARKFLDYKDVVEVEYSANYLDSDSLVRVYQAPNGLTFVHYALEPARLSVAEYEGRFYTTLRVNGTLTAEDGRLAYQFEKALTPQFDREQLDLVQRQPFIVHDMFPVVPGSYRLSILVKNEVSKEFTTLEHNLTVLDRQTGVRLMPLLLAYKAAPASPAADRLRPFHLAGNQLYPQPNRIFVRSDSLEIVFQVLDLPQEVRNEGEFVFTFLQGDQVFRAFRRPLSAYPSAPEFLESVSLEDFPPAHYTVTVGLDFRGKRVVSVSEPFDVTHRESIPRPWVYAKVQPGADDASHRYSLGLQLLNLDRLEEAKVLLERAVAAQPDSWEYALALSQACLAMRDYARVESLLDPFLKGEKAARYEIYVILAKALKESGRLERAVEVLSAAVSHYGVNTALLNPMGECYLGLGRKDEARVVWEKSLELSPDQPALKRSLEGLKE